MAGYNPYMMNPGNYAALTPYQQQFMQPMQSMYSQTTQMSYNQMNQIPKPDFIGAFVNNFDEVKSYPIPIGSTIMLMEKNSNKFYMKMIDNNGNQLINTFTFEDSSVNSPEITDIKDNSENRINELKCEVTETFNLMHSRISKLEEQINSLNELSKPTNKGGR